MGSAKAVKAGRGFIVKMAGDWFRVPKKLVKDGKVDLGDLTKHVDSQKARRAARGKKYNKPARRDLFLGKTPGHTTPNTGTKVKERMSVDGTYRRTTKKGKTVEEVEYPKGCHQH